MKSTENLMKVQVMNTYCISSTMFNICASKKCRSDTKATESVTPCPAGRFEGGILQVCTVLCPVLNLCVVTGSRSFSIPQAAPSHVEPKWATPEDQWTIIHANTMPSPMDNQSMQTNGHSERMKHQTQQGPLKSMSLFVMSI